jgi:hypothetical protein
VRLAANTERINAAGGEVVAVSVDDDGRQAAMQQRWGLTHTRLVSDPGGEQILAPLGLFDPEERGGIGRPGMLVVAPDGHEVYRYEGRDFADRTTDDDVFRALESLGLAPADPGPWIPEAKIPAELKRFFRPSDFGPYFRGNRFGAIAIAGRLDERSARSIAREHQAMCEANLAAWDVVSGTLG